MHYNYHINIIYYNYKYITIITLQYILQLKYTIHIKKYNILSTVNFKFSFKFTLELI